MWLDVEVDEGAVGAQGVPILAEQLAKGIAHGGRRVVGYLDAAGDEIGAGGSERAEQKQHLVVEGKGDQSQRLSGDEDGAGADETDKRPSPAEERKTVVGSAGCADDRGDADDNNHLRNGGPYPDRRNRLGLAVAQQEGDQAYQAVAGVTHEARHGCQAHDAPLPRQKLACRHRQHHAYQGRQRVQQAQNEAGGAQPDQENGQKGDNPLDETDRHSIQHQIALIALVRRRRAAQQVPEPHPGTSRRRRATLRLRFAQHPLGTGQAPRCGRLPGWRRASPCALSVKPAAAGHETSRGRLRSAQARPASHQPRERRQDAQKNDPPQGKGRSEADQGVGQMARHHQQEVSDAPMHNGSFCQQDLA